MGIMEKKVQATMRGLIHFHVPVSMRPRCRPQNATSFNMGMRRKPPARAVSNQIRTRSPECKFHAAKHATTTKVFAIATIRVHIHVIDTKTIRM